jgi:hypothetical protein
MGTVIDLATGECRVSTHRQVRLARLHRKRAAFFRDAAAAYTEGPTAWTSDAHINDIYQKVTRGFRDACQHAGKTPPNRWKVNFIVLKFLEVSEVVGAEILGALLECEIKWYLRFGLRKIYDYELRP